MPTVLVVDESLSVSKAVERALVPHGIGVVGMASAATALAYLEGEVPDLLICHLEPAGFDAFELCAAVRQMPALAETPIVGLATRVWPDLRSSAAAAGVVTVLLRPFDARDLAATVERLLERAGAPTPVIGAGALREPLGELLRLEGFRCAFLASPRGAVIDAIGSLSTVAAVSGSELEGLVRAAALAAASGGLGELNGTILEASHGVVLARRLDADALLVVVVSAATPLGLVRFHFERAWRALQQEPGKILPSARV